MDIKRYITIQAIKTNKNEIIPIWDDRIIYEKSDHSGEYLKLNGNYEKYYTFIECLYDLKTKQISAGIDINIYPSIEELRFKIGEVVYFEFDQKQIREEKIEQIVYEKYDLRIKKGKKIEQSYINKIKDIQIEDDSLYSIKTFIPTYILSSGQRVDYDLYLYKKN